MLSGIKNFQSKSINAFDVFLPLSSCFTCMYEFIHLCPLYATKNNYYNKHSAGLPKVSAPTKYSSIISDTIH